MGGDYGLRGWTRDDYQSFVKDLSRVKGLVSETIAEEKRDIATAKAALPVSRSALPRPQRFAGKGNALPLSTAKLQAHVNTLGSTEVSGLLQRLTDWTADRFNVNKYDTLMLEVERAGASDVEQRIKDVMLLPGGGYTLNPDRGSGAWLFNLNADERRATQAAFRDGMTMTNTVVQALDSGLDADQKKIYSDYFRVGVDDIDTFAEVSRKFGCIQAGMNGANSTHVILGRGGAQNLGRDSMAYVRPGTYPINLGALIFFGPDFWRQVDSGDGGPTATVKRGATIVHEVSHLFAGTKDVDVDAVNGKKKPCYGRSSCLKLPADMALENADTYCLFAQEIHMLGVRKSAELASMWAELDAQSEAWQKMLEDWPT